MEIIPVIDVMGGVVVRARMGQREQYRPIVTPLSATNDPVDVARGLLSIHAFKTLYVADLDAIAGRQDNRAALIRLRAQFPQLALWVDNGICIRGSAQNWLDAGWGTLVLERVPGRRRACPSLRGRYTHRAVARLPGIVISRPACVAG